MHYLFKAASLCSCGDLCKRNRKGMWECGKWGSMLHWTPSSGLCLSWEPGASKAALLERFNCVLPISLTLVNDPTLTVSPAGRPAGPVPCVSSCFSRVGSIAPQSFTCMPTELVNKVLKPLAPKPQTPNPNTRSLPFFSASQTLCCLWHRCWQHVWAVIRQYSAHIDTQTHKNSVKPIPLHGSITLNARLQSGGDLSSFAVLSHLPTRNSWVGEIARTPTSANY